MLGEADNLPQGGTDNAQTSTNLDNPANWDYYDPDDDKKQDTVRPPSAKGNESGQAESAEDAQEAEKSEQTEDEPESEAEEPQDGQPAAPNDDVSVTMSDGKAVTLGELKQGYFRQADYTRKSQELSNRRNEIEQLSNNTLQTMRAVASFLESALPPRPDPMMAATDPAKFIAQKAQYDNAVEKLQHAHRMAAQPEQALDQLNEQEQREYLQAERSRMIEVLPRLASDKGRKAFLERADEIGSVAGYSPEDIRGITDHRQMVILDLAIEGMAARKAKQVAKAKVADVPPVTPSRQKAPQGSATKNRDAMRRLSQSGSLKDAMLVDFD